MKNKLFNSYLKAYSELSRTIEVPPFATPNQIVLDNEKFSLRCFSEDLDDPLDDAVLILPPQAGHHSAICDLSETNSLVRTLLNSGVRSLFAVEWKTAKNGHSSIADLILQTDLCLQYIGQPIHLIGLCQGGWQAVLYTGHFRHKVQSLTIAGAPIDTHIGGGKLQDWLKVVPYGFFKTVVEMHYGIYPGALQLAAFKGMNFIDRYFIDQLKLLRQIDDQKYVAARRIFSNWYEYTQDLSGGWFLEAIDRLFYKNEIHKLVDLSKIHCPINMVAGTRDDLTLVPQVFALERLVSTPDIQKRRYVVDSGHIGLFMGSNALTNTWPIIAKRLIA